METSTIRLSEEDRQIVDHAVREIVMALGLDPTLPNPRPLELVRLYDNLATQFAGDPDLMRHWVHTGNLHLKYTPRLRVHAPYHLGEMNEYLEGFRYR
jgi:hypothetical protein